MHGCCGGGWPEPSDTALLGTQRRKRAGKSSWARCMRRLVFDHCMLCCPAAQDCFELGVILLRKKLYTQATKTWRRPRAYGTASPRKLAQVRPRHPGSDAM